MLLNFPKIDWLMVKCGKRIFSKRQRKLIAFKNVQMQTIFTSAINFYSTVKLVQKNNNLNQKICSKKLSSDVYQYLHKDFRINNLTAAKELVNHFQPKERALLMRILSEKCSSTKDCQLLTEKFIKIEKIKFLELKQIFIISALPFIGFGILDNMIMLLAGEYINNTLGLLFGISTMAAAALGNIISDVAGIGLAYYVEMVVSYFGFCYPNLTTSQIKSKQFRFTVNLSRVFGLAVGCFIGMFPLLFFKKNDKIDKKDDK